MELHKDWYFTQKKWNKMRKDIIKDYPDQINETDKTITEDILCPGCNKVFNIPYYGTKYELCPDCAIEFQFWFTRTFKLIRDPTFCNPKIKLKIKDAPICVLAL